MKRLAAGVVMLAALLAVVGQTTATPAPRVCRNAGRSVCTALKRSPCGALTSSSARMTLLSRRAGLPPLCSTLAAEPPPPEEAQPANATDVISSSK